MYSFGLQRWDHPVAVVWRKCQRKNCQCGVARTGLCGRLDDCWQHLHPARPDGVTSYPLHAEALGTFLHHLSCSI